MQLRHNSQIAIGWGLVMLTLSTLVVGRQMMVTHAQDAPPDGLNNEPLPLIWYGYGSPKIIWLDDDTFWFEAYAENGISIVTYEYNMQTGTLSPLATTPLRITNTEENAALRLRLGAPIWRSPFWSQRTTPVVYQSVPSVHCTDECLGDSIMLGEHREAAPLSPGISVDAYARCGLGVTWGRKSVVILHLADCYGNGGDDLVHVSFSQRRADAYPTLYIGHIALFNQHLLAVSEDGSRVLYDSYPLNNPSGESLYYWESRLPTKTESEPSLVRQVELVAGNEELTPFAAANFIEDVPAEIYAVHTDGLLRINIDTNEREILNPEINSRWMRVGYFSPDNSHLALFTWSNQLYVVETGLGDK